jgi:hypothetical protein
VPLNRSACIPGPGPGPPPPYSRTRTSTPGCARRNCGDHRSEELPEMGRRAGDRHDTGRPVRRSSAVARRSSAADRTPRAPSTISWPIPRQPDPPSHALEERRSRAPCSRSLTWRQSAGWATKAMLRPR